VVASRSTLHGGRGGWVTVLREAMHSMYTAAAVQQRVYMNNYQQLLKNDKSKEEDVLFPRQNINTTLFVILYYIFLLLVLSLEGMGWG
jgi:hypothetical protein